MDLNLKTVAATISAQSEAQSQGPHCGKTVSMSNDMVDGVFSRCENIKKPVDTTVAARDEAIRRYIHLKREELRLKLELDAMSEKFHRNGPIDQGDLH